MDAFKKHYVALALLPAVIASFLIQACWGPNAVAQSNAVVAVDPIEGAWKAAVTITDCRSGQVVSRFQTMNFFTRGGAMFDTSEQAPVAHGTVVGTWTRSDAPARYTTTQRLLRYNADGTLAGAQNITRVVTLTADHNALTGTVSAQLLGPNGAVLQTVCGTETTSRLS